MGSTVRYTERVFLTLPISSFCWGVGYNKSINRTGNRLATQPMFPENHEQRLVDDLAWAVNEGETLKTPTWEPLSPRWHKGNKSMTTKWIVDKQGWLEEIPWLQNVVVTVENELANEFGRPVFDDMLRRHWDMDWGELDGEVRRENLVSLDYAMRGLTFELAEPPLVRSRYRTSFVSTFEVATNIAEAKCSVVMLSA